MDPVTRSEATLDRVIEHAPAAPGRGPAASQLRHLVDVFADQVRSRALDVMARELKARDAGYYTISSAGHEHTAVVGALTEPDDPALLHYRDGGFVMARSRRAGVDTIERDTLLSFCAAAEDPASGGRHKVWGSRRAWIVPQTSTIASQLPKAMGAAVALGRSRRLGRPAAISDDAIVITSFGDASANHASAVSAINAARWAHRVGSPVPLLLVCEDNGIGISVASPRGWITETYGAMPGLSYVPAFGELDEIWDAVSTAVDRCRQARQPVFLHLEAVRLWGHAGADLESGYRSTSEIEADQARDPLPRAAARLLELGATTRDELRTLVAGTRARIRAIADDVVTESTHLSTAEAVVAPLAPHRPDAVRELARRTAAPTVRAASFRRGLPEEADQDQRQTLAGNLNAALHDLLLVHDEAVIFGEDVGRKGGVYGVTAGLQAEFGAGRVFDTLLDETSILGLAQGFGLFGQLPIAEIQYLAYLHNAIDQLRGEACSTSFFSAGQFTTPMVVRIAGLAYQKGFGGHFHNDNAIGALREIPGLALAVPSRPADAVRMLRAAAGMAVADGRVVAFLEPIALYHERDLYEHGDGGWLQQYPADDQPLLPGEVGIYEPSAHDLLLVTYGNGLRMSLRAALRLREVGIRARVLDLRWLAPLPREAVQMHAADVGAVLVVDECRRTGAGIADAVIASLVESDAPPSRIGSVRSVDSYVPLGPASNAVLLDERQIIEAATRLTEMT